MTVWPAWPLNHRHVVFREEHKLTKSNPKTQNRITNHGKKSTLYSDIMIS